MKKVKLPLKVSRILRGADKCELKSFKCLVEIRAYNEEDMREQLDSLDNYELEWFCVGGSDE